LCIIPNRRVGISRAFSNVEIRRNNLTSTLFILTVVLLLWHKYHTAGIQYIPSKVRARAAAGLQFLNIIPSRYDANNNNNNNNLSRRWPYNDHSTRFIISVIRVRIPIITPAWCVRVWAQTFISSIKSGVVVRGRCYAYLYLRMRYTYYYYYYIAERRLNRARAADHCRPTDTFSNILYTYT